jgi:predicted ATP-grasp superfamily ATP-dependent carboligase
MARVRIGVVVLGMTGNGVGAIHSLRELSPRPDPLIGVGSDPHDIGFASRAARTLLAPSPSEGSGGPLARFLVGLSREVGRPLALIPSSDDYVAFVSDHRDDFEGRCRFLLPDRATVDALLDKARFAALVAELGIPAPASAVMAAEPDPDLPEGLRFPIVAKPLTTFKHNPLRKAFKAREFGDREEWNRFFAPWRGAGAQVAVQEKIVGEDDAVYVYGGLWDAAGRPVSAFTGQKLRQFPAAYGSTSRAVCRLEPEVFERSEAFLRAIGHRGLADVEFKRDARDGLLRIIEVNPRQGLWHRMGRTVGIDLVQDACRLASGERLRPIRQRAGVQGHWCYLARDLQRLRQDLRRGPRHALPWFASYIVLPTDAVFSWFDPAPWALELRRLATRRARAIEPPPRARPVAGRSAPPAVVMGLTATGLAVARALGRRQIPVSGISSGVRPPAARSRYLDFVRGPGLDRGRALRFYEALGERLGPRAVLVPTGDPNVLFIARNRAALSRHFRFVVPDVELLEAIASKRRLVGIAESHGLPVPPTILPADRAELEASIENLRFPVVIKPEFSNLWRSREAAHLGLGRTKAIPVDSGSDLLRRYADLAKLDSRLLVQQLVIGPDENHVDYHAFVDSGGTVRAEFVGRKLRLAPAHYGMGCYVESVHADDVSELGRDILHRIGYRGMANLNFKRDARDGKLYLLEINPRFSIWTGLDVACGVDFPYYYYRAALGEPFTAPRRYPAGRRWWDPVADLRSMRVYTRDGTWSWVRWLGTVARPSTNAVFAWDDPGPAWETLKRSLRHRLEIDGEPAK